MRRVAGDKKQQVVRDMLDLFGLPAPVFTLSHPPESISLEREYSVDLEVLKILYEIARSAALKVKRG